MRKQFPISVWVYPRQATHFGRIFDMGNGAANDNVLLTLV